MSRSWTSGSADSPGAVDRSVTKGQPLPTLNGPSVRSGAEAQFGPVSSLRGGSFGAEIPVLKTGHLAHLDPANPAHPVEIAAACSS
jgi:hypothetical protein